jgi:hypothetical protein
MRYEMKLGLDRNLYDQVTHMAGNPNDAKSFQEFNKIKLKKVEEKYLEYKDTDISVLLLHNFLSLHSLHNPAHKSILKIKETTITDVTKTFGYSDLIDG